MAKKADAWNELNDRQKNTLTAIYRADQKAENDEAASWRLRVKRRPAAIWRNLRYPDLNGYETFLHLQLREAGVIDSGLGSTLAALERRRFVESHWLTVEVGEPKLISVKLTNMGRALARASLGESAVKKIPKGQLKQWQWECLIAACVAGDTGLPYDDCGNYGGFSFEWTCRRLRDYYDTDNGLVKERSRFEYNEVMNHSERVHELVITESGKQFYQDNYQYYRELYPEVETPSLHV